MKKSAAEYKKTRVARTGKINPNRLHAFKISDDLFAKAEIHPDGKNHGLCIMVDWSGSMTDAFRGVIRQLLQLVWFCQKVNIPFEVVTFTSRTDENLIKVERMTEADYKNGEYMVLDSSCLYMVNILSSKMKTKELNTAIKFLWFKMNGEINTPLLREGGTPLSEAIMIYTSFAKEMKDNFKLDKISSIIITDGEGGIMQKVKGATNEHVSFGKTSYLKDGVTGKTVRAHDPKMAYGGNNSASQVAALLNILKIRVEGPVVGFFLIADYQLRRAWGLNAHTDTDNTTTKRILRKEGMMLGTRRGYDKYFVITTKAMMIDVVDEELKAGTGTQVARQLAKRGKGKKASRKILGQFVETVA